MRAISSMSAMSQHGAAIIDADDRLINSQKRQHSIQVMTLQNTLKASRKKTSSLVTKLWKLKNRDIQKGDRSNWPLAKQTMAVRALVNGCQQDAVAALEAHDGLKNTVLKLQETNALIMGRLKLTEGKLQSALAICAKPENNPTNWVDKLGKRGARYDVFIIEMGIQLMSSELSAAQAVYALTVFMRKSYPDLKSGVDYRIPGESTFKEWGESIYEITCTVNRSRLDDASIIFYMHDDSPRNGYNYHGMTCAAVFPQTDGDGVAHVQHHVPLGLEILANGAHQPQADKGVEVLGSNLPKMVSTMADNAAKDVGDKMCTAKEIAVAALMGEGHNFTDAQLEVMSTTFVDTCITHGGDLVSKMHFKEICTVMAAVIINYNAATIIQTATGKWLIRQRMKGTRMKAVWTLWAKLLCGKLSRETCFMPMKLIVTIGDEGTPKKQWQLCGEVEDIWGLMCSMSNLISHQGKHADYYLNESKAFRLFWVQADLPEPYLLHCPTLP